MTGEPDLDANQLEEEFQCECEGECACFDEIWEQERAESLIAIQHKADFAVSQLIMEAIGRAGLTDAWDDAWEAMSRATLFSLSEGRDAMNTAQEAEDWRDAYRKEMLQILCSIIDEHAEVYEDSVTAKDYLETALESYAG